MKFSLITFRSVTLAQKGMRMLQDAGFHCSIQRTPRWMEEQGCGYSVRIRYADAQSCVQLLRDSNMTFRKVYLLRENGNIEELGI